MLNARQSYQMANISLRSLRITRFKEEKAPGELPFQSLFSATLVMQISLVSIILVAEWGLVPYRFVDFHPVESLTSQRAKWLV